MPFEVVNLWPGDSEPQKMPLAEAILKDGMNVLNSGEVFVSAAFKEVEPPRLGGEGLQPDIVNNSENLYKKPGYTMETRRRDHSASLGRGRTERYPQQPLTGLVSAAERAIGQFGAVWA